MYITEAYALNVNKIILEENYYAKEVLLSSMWIRK